MKRPSLTLSFPLYLNRTLQYWRSQGLTESLTSFVISTVVRKFWTTLPAGGAAEKASFAGARRCSLCFICCSKLAPNDRNLRISSLLSSESCCSAYLFCLDHKPCVIFLWIPFLRSYIVKQTELSLFCLFLQTILLVLLSQTWILAWWRVFFHLHQSVDLQYVWD